METDDAIEDNNKKKKKKKNSTDSVLGRDDHISFRHRVKTDGVQ